MTCAFTQTLEVFHGFASRASVNRLAFMEQRQMIKQPKNGVAWLVDGENNSSTAP